MQLSILIPTYGRPNDLQRLLGSVAAQQDPPEEVLVVVGPGDSASWAVAGEWQPRLPTLRVLWAQKKSVVHAINLGFSVAQGDVICLLDDDVWIPEDYIHKIRKAYVADPRLGAYGGRDHLQMDNPQLANPPLARLVGTYRWFGRFEGNHHCGVRQSPAQVHVLKGVNISFRRAAFPSMQIEPALEGRGAEACWEADISLRVGQAGYRVVYDNDNYVLHYAAPRSDYDSRSDLFSPAVPARLYNDALTIARFRPPLEIVTYSLMYFLIGSRSEPGVAWSMLLVPKYGPKVLKLPWRHAGPMWRGTVRGLRLRRQPAPTPA